MNGEQLKPGYKRTEVGVIPDNWTVLTLAQACAKITDGTHDTPTPVTFGRPFLTAIHIKENLIDYDNCLYLKEEDHRAIYTRCNPQYGDVLMVNIGAGVATTALVDANFEFSLKNVALLKPKHELVYGALLNYTIIHRKSKIINSLSTGGAQPFLSLSKIGEIKIALAPLPEQREIISALSEIDAALSTLDNLIHKKRDLRRAVMQKLLTGQIRLPGFSDEWQVKRLEEVVEFHKGQLITEKEAVAGPIPVIAGGKKPSYFHNVANRTGKTITVSASGASAGYVAFYKNPIFASDCSTIGESGDYSIDYIYFQLLLHQEDIYKSQTGGAQPHIQPADLKPIEIFICSTSEQRAIATVLSDMDAELGMLEVRREKTQVMKQGIMNALLTGESRLI